MRINYKHPAILINLKLNIWLSFTVPTSYLMDDIHCGLHGIFDEFNEFSVVFTHTQQIFYPYSIQTHEREFPGADPNDCPRNIKRDQWVHIFNYIDGLLWPVPKDPKRRLGGCRGFSSVYLKSYACFVLSTGHWYSSATMRTTQTCTAITGRRSSRKPNTTGGGRRTVYSINWMPRDITLVSVNYFFGGSQ